MMRIDYRALVGRLNRFTKSNLESAAALALSYTHYDLDLEHFLYKLMESREGDVYEICQSCGIEMGRVEKALVQMFESMKRGNGNLPGLSPHIPRLLQDAWMLASVEFGDQQIRSAYLMLALLQNQDSYCCMLRLEGEFSKINIERVKASLTSILQNSVEFIEGASSESPLQSRSESSHGEVGLRKNLLMYTIDLTRQAREGKLDSVVGRDSEIRDAIDILIRRRKNNPLFIGEAGVGKTAVVEGLALRIAQGDVPQSLKEVALLLLDLGALQAGAGVRGEFEKRLKEVIKEVNTSAQPIILFIDEIHTLMGAGGKEGAGDAANLLKPALARGELRMIGATTVSEHKQFIAKDPALDRRFQTIMVDEPDEERAILMMRSIVPSFEQHHGVRILEEAVVASVKLGSRYIQGRQLPDKSVDLIDTACARVALAMASTPPSLELARRNLLHLTLELDRCTREHTSGECNHADKIAALRREKETFRASLAMFEAQWALEKGLVEQIHTQRELLETLTDVLQHTEQQELIQSMIVELEELQGDNPMVHINVDAQAIGRVVSSWTGIPVGRMVSDEMSTLLTMGDALRERVKGQDHALAIIADTLRTARYNLANPNQPIGIFLLVGPSGVGKTETAMALSERLFGGEKQAVVINMSEYKEAHASSRLIGPPPGYVGFGKGGVLTEKVRSRPYSVVLLDEIEKAHYDVREFFQQVFDKGYLADSEGQVANFQNTVIFMTANVGDETILNACFEEHSDGAITMKTDLPTREELTHLLMPELLKYFSSSLLARVTIVPYYPLTDETLESIIRLKLNQVGTRLQENHQIAFHFDEEVIDQINARCTEVQSGARNVNRIVNGAILPKISSALISKVAEGNKVDTVVMSCCKESGTFLFDVRAS